MPAARRALLASLLIAASLTSGCIELLIDELEESRDDARRREAGGWDEPLPVVRAEGPAWPMERSFVRYHYMGTQDGLEVVANITLTFRHERWHGECFGTRNETDEAGRTTRTTFRENVSFEPPAAPLDVRAGQRVLVPILRGCATTELELVVDGTTNQSAPRVGTVPAWHADEPAERAEGRSDDAWWAQETNLVLAWNSVTPERTHRGWLVDTDASLLDPDARRSQR